MADALCGPSNALQSFQKHSSVDRTLQQDRLAAHRREALTFRSAPGPNAGILDAEYEAFQASRPVPPSYTFENPISGTKSPPPAHFSAQQQPPLPDWASDFQSLRLNEQSNHSYPTPHQHPASLNAASSWHREYLEGPKNPYVENQQQNGQASSYQFQPGSYNNPQMSHSGQYFNLSDGSRNVNPSELGQQGTDELFDREFAQAEKEAEFTHPQNQSEAEKIVNATKEPHKDQGLSTAGVISNTARDQETPGNSKPEEYIIHDRIGSDRILDQAEEIAHADKLDESDELARTAGTLLERVKDDRSQKFQQSNFLLLMRQLRDREVRVDGNKLVDTTQPLHPGGEFYPSE